MDNDLVYGILYISFESIDEIYPTKEIPSVLSKDIKRLISNKCFSFLNDEYRIIPKSLVIIPFPSLNLKGLIRYFEWTDEKQPDKAKQAAILILFKESDDLIFYKYIEIFEPLLKKYSKKIRNLEITNANDEIIYNNIEELLLETKEFLEDFKNKELSEQKSEEFPEDPSELYDTSEYSFKIIIVGDPEVGKTSITLRFTNKAFLRTYIPTLGVNITDKNIRVDHSIIKVIIWDIAGQSKFQTTRKNFYRGAEGIILVFDLTWQKSFDNLSNWYQDVIKTLNIQKNFVGFIIGNKNDLKNERKVKREDAETLANKLNLRYIETSALTGENIMFIFHKMGEILLSNFLNNLS